MKAAVAAAAAAFQFSPWHRPRADNESLRARWANNHQGTDACIYLVISVPQQNLVYFARELRIYIREGEKKGKKKNIEIDMKWRVGVYFYSTVCTTVCTSVDSVIVVRFGIATAAARFVRVANWLWSSIGRRSGIHLSAKERKRERNGKKGAREEHACDVVLISSEIWKLTV